MIVLQILDPVGIGGVERIADVLFDYFNQNGSKAYIAISKGMYQAFSNQFNIKDSSMLFTYDDSSLISKIIGLRRVINFLRPDIIQTHSRRENLYAALLKNNNVVIRTQHMQESYRFPMTWFEKCLVKKKTDCWIATSKTLQDTFLRRQDFVDATKTCVIYNGVSSSGNENEGNGLGFCIISRLTKQKGIDILIDKVSEMPSKIREHILIDFYGEGEELDDLLERIRNHHMEKVIRYCGKTKDPQAIFPQYKALLMPSRYEGLPLTMLEAMADGTPVATHNVGCVSEFIRSHVNGWIIDETYPWESYFEDSVFQRYEWKKISLAATNTYKDNFSVETMCRKYEEKYEEVLRVKRKAYV